MASTLNTESLTESVSDPEMYTQFDSDADQDMQKLKKLSKKLSKSDPPSHNSPSTTNDRKHLTATARQVDEDIESILADGLSGSELLKCLIMQTRVSRMYELRFIMHNHLVSEAHEIKMVFE
jgi:flagellar hook-length control protein FliK